MRKLKIILSSEKLRMFVLIMLSVGLIFNVYKKIQDSKIVYDDSVCCVDSTNIISQEEFLEMNSDIESNGDWYVANRFGYLGKYQLGRQALEDVGYEKKWINKLMASHKLVFVKGDDGKVRKEYTFNKKLFPPHKQEEAIRKYLDKMENHYLKEHIEEYVGREIDGVKITKAGILSASFFGYTKVKAFLNSMGKTNKKDGNGYSIKRRLEVFENCDIN